MAGFPRYGHICLCRHAWKSKGQIFRIGAALHILFEMFPSDEEAQPSDNITEDAIVAAINFTELCL